MIIRSDVSRSLTAYDVQRAQRDIWEQIETVFIADFSWQFLHQNRTLLLKHVDEIFQDFEMECWRQNLQREKKTREKKTTNTREIIKIRR